MVNKRVNFRRSDSLGCDFEYVGRCWLLGGEMVGGLPECMEGELVRNVASLVVSPHVLAEVTVRSAKFWESLKDFSELVGVVWGDPGFELEEHDLRPLLVRSADEAFLDALAVDLPGGMVGCLFADGTRQGRRIGEAAGAEAQWFVCDFRSRPEVKPDEEYLTFDPFGRACWALESLDEWISNPLEVVFVDERRAVNYRVQDAWNDDFVRNAEFFSSRGGSQFLKLREGALAGG